jgi:CDP-paratose 2-epimerase
MKHVLITGSGGRVGSEAAKFFSSSGYTVLGIDNDMHSYFFGTSTKSVSQHLQDTIPSYIHCSIDIRDVKALEELFVTYKDTLECVIHCAAQPSHDWSAKEPLTDFSINATATLILLELTRRHIPKASFIFMSTNKVYGDTPNRLPLIEQETRYEVPGYAIDETMSVDHCKHSIFGVSKLSADMMVQEYGRYFGMNTVVFRGGCITGPNHQGAPLHGFLSYLVKCIVTNQPYTIYGYKGKQVRDNIHSYDLVNAFWHYHQNPTPAAVYNMGGGRENSISILETIQKVNSMIHSSWDDYTYTDKNHPGDHIWYISDVSKFQKDYPSWSITYSIERILSELVQSYSPEFFTSKLMGGVGNQMFQIAIAYAMSRRFHKKLLFEKMEFGGCRQGSHPSKYYTNLFQKVPFVDSIPRHIEIFEKEFPYHPVHNDVQHILPMDSAGISFHGYWQSDLYFRDYSDEIRELFTPSGGIISYLEEHSDLFIEFPELKESHDYCFIGVRRGDYISHAHVHNPCGMTYYKAAMERMKKERYYISSDDIEWCKEHFQGDQYRFFTLKDDLLQLFATSLFKNYIISNSTFYWWGSFMSIYKNPTIVAPDKWIFGADVTPEKYDTIYRESMVVLERPIELT